MHNNERERQVRLGLVMYGGVSLAIYINGVAHQFFHAVRGTGVYGLIKALTDSDIIVDVISGTSAGGINGVLLGHCLTNKLDFGECAHFWRENGAIERLLRDAQQSPNNTHSLLDSEGFYQPKLEEAFASLLGTRAPIPADQALVSDIEELDLFITSTDAHGQVFTVFDDSGHEVTVKDHRAVFILKHRSGRKEPFNPHWKGEGHEAEPDEVIRALAKLCRLTSAFPVAFAPVHVEHREEEAPLSADALLTRWGALTKDTYFLDGGILDNKPFTHAIRAIYSRTALRPVERHLFYVEPVPEQFVAPIRATQPDFFRVITDSLSGIPSYESIADDLIALREHNTSVHDLKELLELLDNTKPEDVPDAAAVRLYGQARWHQIRRRTLQGILKDDGRRVLLEGPRLTAARALVSAFNKLTDRNMGGLEDFDVYFRLRRMFDLQYRLLEKDPQGPLPEVVRAIERLEIVRHRMEALVDEARFAWDGIYRQSGRSLDAGHERLSAPARLRGPVQNGEPIESNELGRVLTKRKSSLVQQIRDGQMVAVPPTWESMLRGLDRFDASKISNHSIARERFEMYPRLDARVFPMQLVAGFEERVVSRRRGSAVLYER
jgi:patatin-related protein